MHCVRQFVWFWIRPYYWWLSEYSGYGIAYLHSCCCHHPGLCTVQEDHQETGVVETRFGSDGDVEMPHAVVNDWGSTFDFQNGTLGQRVKINHQSIIDWIMVSDQLMVRPSGRHVSSSITSRASISNISARTATSVAKSRCENYSGPRDGVQYVWATSPWDS